MSLIPCGDNCIYQKDGYCTLDTPSTVTNGLGGCIYAVERTQDNKDKNATHHANQRFDTDP